MLTREEIEALVDEARRDNREYGVPANLFGREELIQLFTKVARKAERSEALIPEDMGVIYNLVRDLQSKYNDFRGCFREALELFNKGRNGNE